MKKTFICLMILVVLVGCSTKKKEEELVLAPVITDAKYPCDGGDYLWLDGEVFMFGYENSDDAYFGTYHPVGTFTYEASIRYGGAQDSEETTVFFSIIEGRVYFSNDTYDTIEDMETRTDNNYYCTVE